MVDWHAIHPETPHQGLKPQPDFTSPVARLRERFGRAASVQVARGSSECVGVVASTLSPTIPIFNGRIS